MSNTSAATLKEKVLAKATATNAKISASPSQEDAQANPVSVPAPSLPVETIEETYQAYKSTIDNQKIAMPSGKLIKVTAGKYITKDPEEIEFLDHEISRGFPYLRKNGTVVTSDLDPMSALRKKLYAEFLEAQKQGLIEVPKPTLGDSGTQAITPANSALLKALSADSSSVAE